MASTGRSATSAGCAERRFTAAGRADGPAIGHAGVVGCRDGAPVRADGAASAAWWAAPTRRVSHLRAVDPELLRVALDPLPPAAPAVVHYRPRVVGSLGDLVDALLDQLDSAALAMFPSCWRAPIVSRARARSA
ncbi:hypothetical protein NKG94_14355 [Micromonospora sp. M12]